MHRAASGTRRGPGRAASWSTPLSSQRPVADAAPQLTEEEQDLRAGWDGPQHLAPETELLSPGTGLTRCGRPAIFSRGQLASTGPWGERARVGLVATGMAGCQRPHLGPASGLPPSLAHAPGVRQGPSEASSHRGPSAVCNETRGLLAATFHAGKQPCECPRGRPSRSSQQTWLRTDVPSCCPARRLPLARGAQPRSPLQATALAPSGDRSLPSRSGELTSSEPGLGGSFVAIPGPRGPEPASWPWRPRDSDFLCPAALSVHS